MLPRIPYWFALVRVMALGFVCIPVSLPLRGQQPVMPPGTGSTLDLANNPVFELDVFVRDHHGNPLDAAAAVHITSARLNYDAVLATQGASPVHFTNLGLGEYAVEVTCPGFRKTTERYSSEFSHGTLPVYIYLVPESAPANSAASSSALALTQQQRADMQLGIAALNRDRYETARKTFAKILRKAPGNCDVAYYLGVAEFGLLHLDVARENFQRALALNPNHELALISLGQLQRQSGAPADAIIPLEKAVSLDGAGWRADYELASAYFELHRLIEAESEASRAVHLAKEKGAAPAFLLGEIQYAEGKGADARRTWESILKDFPGDPAVDRSKKMLALMEKEGPTHTPSSNANLPLVLDTRSVPFVELPWAPPDTDEAVYDVAPQVNCKAGGVLDSALQRMNEDLRDFEKFTATEHIEHQDIDSYGWAGPMKSHDFPYVVFVHPLGKNSFYLDEYRDGAAGPSNFSDAVISTGLNTLGVNVLQPFYRDRLNYSCEGLSNVRGQAAWQIRFEEKRDAKAGAVRTWRQGNTLYDIAIKGRMWISSTSYAVLRVETDLREPIVVLGLTKDHLLVDYGPVNFSTGNKQLWLPWSADMYMELRGKRYHHRHFLSDYLLFDVDTAHKIGKPKEPPPARESAAPGEAAP